MKRKFFDLDNEFVIKEISNNGDYNYSLYDEESDDYSLINLKVSSANLNRYTPLGSSAT